MFIRIKEACIDEKAEGKRSPCRRRLGLFAVSTDGDVDYPQRNFARGPDSAR